MKRVKHSKFKMIIVTFSIAIIFSLILSGCPADTLNNTSSTISTPTSEPIHTNPSNLEVTYDEVKYNITASYSSGQDSSYGTFTSTNSNPNSHEVTLEATPKEDNGFIGWASDISGDKIVSYYNPYKFIVTEDVTLYPVFIKGDQDVVLKDSFIASYLLKYYDMSTYTYADLQKIKNLNLVYQDNPPEAFEDIAYFHSLTSLSVSFDFYKEYTQGPWDISPIANLVNLESFQGGGDVVATLPFENYKSLKTLYLNYHGEDIYSILKHKETLEDLALICPNVKSLDLLEDMTNLKMLGLHDSEIKENELDYLPQSIEHLSFVNCKNLKDFNRLSVLTKLKGLGISNTYSLQDISSISQLTTLESLSLRDNYINDISPIGNLVNLKSLTLSNNVITDISPLSALNKLETLDIENNRISDLSPLEHILPHLSHVSYGDFRNNPITDYSLLKEFPSLKLTYPVDKMLKAAESAKAMVEDLIKPGMTDEEKYRVLAIGLLEKSYYLDYDPDAEDVNNAYGTLVVGIPTQCEGNTEAYNMLCAMAGLQSYSASCVNHTWNIVKLDGHYYNVDISMINVSTEGVLNERLFLKSDAFLASKMGLYVGIRKTPDLICDDTSRDDIL